MVENREQNKYPYKFSTGSRLALGHAHWLSQHFFHYYIGTEHLLYGLASTPELKYYMNEIGLTAQKVRGSIAYIVEIGVEKPGSKSGFTPRIMRVFDIAHKESTVEGRKKITPLNLMHAIYIEGEGIAAGILEAEGVEVEFFRDAYLDN